MTWHYAVPSPSPPKSYHTGYSGYRPNETYGEDGTMVTTTTKTTVRKMQICYACIAITHFEMIMHFCKSTKTILSFSEH